MNGKGIPIIRKIPAPGQCIILKSMPIKSTEKAINAAVYKFFNNLSSEDFIATKQAIGKNIKASDPIPVINKIPAPDQCDILKRTANSVIERHIMPKI